MSPAGHRYDPIQNFRFRVEIDGIGQAGFNEVNMPEVEIETIEYREGIDPTRVRKLSGLTKYANVVLKWGVTDSMDLYNWFSSVEQRGAAGNRMNMVIILVDEEGNDKMRWEITRAWPIRYTVSDLNAQTSQVAIEELEMAFERFYRVG
jgi:phage tail-like protein